MQPCQMANPTMPDGKPKGSTDNKHQSPRQYALIINLTHHTAPLKHQHQHRTLIGSHLHPRLGHTFAPCLQRPVTVISTTQCGTGNSPCCRCCCGVAAYPALTHPSTPTHAHTGTLAPRPKRRRSGCLLCRLLLSLGRLALSLLALLTFQELAHHLLCRAELGEHSLVH